MLPHSRSLSTKHSHCMWCVCGVWGMLDGLCLCLLRESCNSINTNSSNKTRYGFRLLFRPQCRHIFQRGRGTSRSPFIHSLLLPLLLFFLLCRAPICCWFYCPLATSGGHVLTTRYYRLSPVPRPPVSVSSDLAVSFMSNCSRKCYVTF